MLGYAVGTIVIMVISGFFGAYLEHYFSKKSRLKLENKSESKKPIRVHSPIDSEFKEKYTTVRATYIMEFSLSEFNTNLLERHLKHLYEIESSFRQLKDESAIAQKEYDLYIEAIDNLLKVKMGVLLRHMHNEYIYLVREVSEFMESSCLRLESVAKDTYKTHQKELKQVQEEKLVLENKVLTETQYQNKFLESIKNNHELLNNVISKSLYENAKQLNSQRDLESRSEEAINIIDSQINQINDFLFKEVNAIATETEEQFINKLKANKLYLDSLDTHWVREEKL